MLKEIIASERLINTINGNPRYRVTFADGSVHTSQSDSGWVYAFGNPGYRIGDVVEIELTKAGRIRRMEPTTQA